MAERRPDPDALLAAVQRAEAQRQRGRLKIFLGMAAGVGKTYSMLEAARQLQAQGVDVVVGYVDTHGRAETTALLEGLEVIPRRQVSYRGTALEEMDLDAILARRPALALVDELAHTNIEGSRHAKRYQDVLELLDAGIDVHTTINVQHIESRSDTVREITGVAVRETVPDSVLDLAGEVELIDLAPDELRKRLFEGKVYTPERVDVAASNFFRIGNLTALREMALRLTAERVDRQLRDYMQVRHIVGPWKSAERLMVGVSPAPYSEQLLRWTRRMADNLEASWLAVHIETPQPLADDDKRRLLEHLALARELGAEVLTLSGADVMQSLMRVAHQQNVTQIVVGKSPRSPLREMLTGGSLVSRIIRASGDIDVYVVTGRETTPRQSAFLPRSGQHSSRYHYLLALGAILGITSVNLVLLPIVGYRAVGLSELLIVLLIAVSLGRGPALLSALLSAVSWNLLFIPPRFTLDISLVEDAILFGMYFIIALIAGNLTARLRAQERQARFRAERTQALYSLTRDVARAVTMDDIVRSAVKQLGSVFDAEVAIYLRNAAGQLEQSAHAASTLRLDEQEFSVAAWAYQNRRRAGRFTDTLSAAAAQYLPLLTPSGPLGVLAIRVRDPNILNVDQEALLETFTSQVALGIERELLDEAAERAAMLSESERLYATLLNSISHELRTPIATIAGAADSLTEPNIERETHRTLVGDIQDAAERLNGLVRNLLDISRLESGRMSLKLEWSDLSDLVGVALAQTERRLARHVVTVEVAPDLPLVQLDFLLMEQVLVNILNNAAIYTPAGTEVIVSARVEAKEAIITIADRGLGLAEPERVFEKFYRAPGAATGGTGLGLAIARGLVEAHGGTIAADNLPGGGARFIIRLPRPSSPPPPREAYHD